MNFLKVGSSNTPFEYEPGSLIISDEPIDGVQLYLPSKHGLNPLPLKYPANRAFAAAAYPDKDLMTYRNGKRALARLVMNADRLDRLQYGRNDDDKEAKGVAQDILLSPLLKRMLREPIPRWFGRGITVNAVLNRKEIGDDDAKVIANILILKWKGQVVCYDYGFYAREHHAPLIRQERLMAEVFTLSELGEPKDKFRQLCMRMPKVGKGCTFEDAVTLATYARLRPDPTREDNPYNNFIDEVMA